MCWCASAGGWARAPGTASTPGRRGRPVPARREGSGEARARRPRGNRGRPRPRRPVAPAPGAETWRRRSAERRPRRRSDRRPRRSGSRGTAPAAAGRTGPLCGETRRLRRRTDPVRSSARIGRLAVRASARVEFVEVVQWIRHGLDFECTMPSNRRRGVDYARQIIPVVNGCGSPNCRRRKPTSFSSGRRSSGS